jgi:hypothetical protein
LRIVGTNTDCVIKCFEESTGESLSQRRRTSGATSNCVEMAPAKV